MNLFKNVTVAVSGAISIEVPIVGNMSDKELKQEIESGDLRKLVIQAISKSAPRVEWELDVIEL